MCVPQKLTDFSPFELLFGRVRGPCMSCEKPEDTPVNPCVGNAEAPRDDRGGPKQS